MSILPDEPRAVVLRDEDNVAVASRPIPAGARVGLRGGRSVETLEPIALGHKLAITEIRLGDPIRKYGQTIGFAARSIPAGSWVHVQNVRADRFAREAVNSASWIPPAVPEPGTFLGYLREDGRVGTRNYIAVVSTVNCSASTSRAVSERFRDEAWRREYPNVDGVFAITHKSGCGLPFEGPDHRILERVLKGFAEHPNVAAYVVVGLGCEVAYAEHLVEVQDLRLREGNGSVSKSNGSRRPRVLTIQQEGGITRTIDAAVEAVRRLLPEANSARRSVQPVSKITLALECGGSDGNSGVTANPALGVASDLLVAAGGTAILGETTEIYGAEHLLAGRASRPEVGEKLLERIRWWEWYTGLFGAEINNNPSPGNKAGGLTTIYEKSLGALAKGGTSPLEDVAEYAARVDGPGLVFMDTPGYDPPCTTGLVASGANVLVFTTGRGSVLGLRPTPCIKVATNTPLYERMKDDMDLDAGTVLEGETLKAAGRRIYEMVVRVASGTPTRSERSGVGEEEFAPWSIGPTL